MKYDLLMPRQVVFGWGRRSEVGVRAAGLGQRVFLVSGSRTLRESALWSEIQQSLDTAKLQTVDLGVISREPEVEDVDSFVARLRDLGGGQPGDVVLAIGGGAALDLGKAVAALATNRQSETVKDYLEGVGRGLQITERPLPLVAMPTTSGTGSEATKNSVISSQSGGFKKSLRSDRMIAEVALLDPELTVSCPRDTTAWSGMDAITQLIESLITPKSTEITRALCHEGLRCAVPWLQRAVVDPTCRPAREAMSHAAFLSGVTLANAGLGMAHGVAAALGVLCGIPHGLACATLLPVALRVNRGQCEPALAQLAPLFSRRSWDTPAAAADFTVEAVRELALSLRIPLRLRDLGVEKNQLPALVPASRGNSMNGNPRSLSDSELSDILEALW
jgi:alcohol dehydrogenase class IV